MERLYTPIAILSVAKESLAEAEALGQHFPGYCAAFSTQDKGKTLSVAVNRAG